MRRLSRYLLSQLVAPLLFAFTALTSIMLLNQVAKRFGALVGKGLPWSVIGEVFLLCIPFIIAMTLPMAVLVAILYAFSHLAADNEITAMRASGVSVWQMLRPVFLAGFTLAAVNFWFTDQILPRSNADLRNLLVNIQRKKPTFELREQVINEIPSSALFLRASRIDPNSGRLRNVTIYDMAAQNGRRIIYADSGRMAYARRETDLSLQLYDGSIHAFKATDPELMQLTYFAQNRIRVKDVSNQLNLDTADGVRGDREMSTCEMLVIVWQADREKAEAERRRSWLLYRDLRSLLGQPLPPPTQPSPPAEPRGYCRWFQKVGSLFIPRTAEAEIPAQAPGVGRPPAQGQESLRARVDSVRAAKLRAARTTASARAGPAVPSASAVDTLDRTTRATRQATLTDWALVTSAREDGRSADQRADQYAVEVHKKWAISAACLVFVVVGIPMALRFPRGGMGLVIGGGLAVFSIYYVGLIAGEGLGNKGIVSPAAAMWGPNAIFTVLGIIGLLRVNRESGSTRGGDLADLRDVLFGWVRRKRTR